MFPESNLTEFIIAGQEQNKLEPAQVGRSFAFDYQTKKFVFTDGKNRQTTKLEAIQQWIELFIRTRSDKFPIYTPEFGVKLDDLLGYRLPRSFVLTEIKRRVVSGILNGCPAVVSVTDWKFNKGSFSFTVTTNTGEEVTIINDL